MTEKPVRRHPHVGSVVLIGIGLMGFSLVIYQAGVGGSTIPFLLGLFGLGITLVAGVWYATLFLYDLFWPSD